MTGSDEAGCPSSMTFSRSLGTWRATERSECGPFRAAYVEALRAPSTLTGKIAKAAGEADPGGLGGAVQKSHSQGRQPLSPRKRCPVYAPP
jgi:hypothetical protein